MQQPFIILDRDGVINYDSHQYIKTPAEWIAIPRSLEAIAALNRAGYRVLIATNQSGIARGYYDLAMLDHIHEKFVQELAAVGGCIERIFFCPHHPDDACGCRKPKPGLIHQIQAAYPICLEQTFFIGDSIVDIELAQEVGCKPLLVLTGNGQQTLAHYQTVPHFEHLASAVDYVLDHSIFKKM